MTASLVVSQDKEKNNPSGNIYSNYNFYMNVSLKVNNIFSITLANDSLLFYRCFIL